MVEPRASFNFGAGGISFALYRVARARDDGELLAFAEVWQRRAESAVEAGEGLYDAVEFRPERLGRISPYHTASGLCLTRAALARAAGDMQQLDAAVDRYVALVSSEETDELDLALGRSGALLGAALLYGLGPRPALRDLGDALVASVWNQLGGEPPVASSRRVAYLGLAHGWAGHVYAALAWARATATPPLDTVVRRLGELSAISAATDLMGRIPVVVPGHELDHGMVRYMDGWCHGQAGHALLRLLAASVLAEPAELEAAVVLGEAAFVGSEDFGDLCCGLAGRAYAMLALHRATRERKWLDRARLLAARATRGTACDRWPNSLYKGRVGLAVVMAELDKPDLAAMPLFEDEGFL